jgi:hypothetical protein
LEQEANMQNRLLAALAVLAVIVCPAPCWRKATETETETVAATAMALL